MHIEMTSISGTIQKGELLTENALSLFPDGTQVYVISRESFHRIAGSDHAIHRATVAEQALEQIAKQPEKAQEILAQREAKR